MGYYYEIETMHKSLSATDLREICKKRNFPITNNMSEDTFKNFFLSTVGVEKTLSSLTSEEIFLLLLIQDGKEVNVQYFSSIYKNAERYGTFTQQYKNTYKSIQENLIRAGILIAFENRYDSHKTSKLERMRFIFPVEFKKYIPAPFKNIKDSEVTISEEADSELRGKVVRIVNQKSINANNICIEDGSLKYQGELFKTRALHNWRLEKLTRYVNNQRKSSRVIFLGDLEKLGIINIAQILVDSLSKLKANQCIPTISLSPIFNLIYRDGHNINSEEVLNKMVDLGFLTKLQLEGINYYHYNDSLEKNNLDPEEYLSAQENRFLIDPKIPYKALEQLSTICNFTVDKKKLYINPNFAKIVKKYSQLNKTPLLLWLKEKSKTIASKLNDIEKIYGKILLHSNILIAKINDFKLKAILQKNYNQTNKMIFLPNDYIVALKEERKNIEKLVLKSGFAVKIK